MKRRTKSWLMLVWFLSVYFCIAIGSNLATGFPPIFIIICGALLQSGIWWWGLKIVKKEINRIEKYNG